MKNKNKLFLFAAALFFSSVFFVGVDKLNNVAKALTQQQCDNLYNQAMACMPNYEGDTSCSYIENAAADCVVDDSSTLDVSDMTMDGAYNTDCSSWANTKPVSGKCECYDNSYTQASDGSCYVNSNNACSNNYETSECCTANAGYWYNGTCNTSPNAGTVGNGCTPGSTECGSGYKCDTSGTCMVDSMFSSAECKTDGDCSNYGSGFVCSGYIVKTCEKATPTTAPTAADKKDAQSKFADANSAAAAVNNAKNNVNAANAAVANCGTDTVKCAALQKAADDANKALIAANAAFDEKIALANAAAVVANPSATSTGAGFMLCANGILATVCSGNVGTPIVAGISIGGGSYGGGLGGYSGGTTGIAAPKCGANFQDIGGVCFPMTIGLSNAPINVILTNLLSWLMMLFTTFAIIAFVVSGIQYFMASGDESMAEKAKENATNAIIGIIVGLSGFIIIKAIATALSGQSMFF